MERLRKTWPEWARVAAPAVLVTAAVFLTIFATSFRVSIYPSGRWVSVDVQENVAQAAITVTALGTAQDKAGTSPWTAKTGLSLAVDDYVFVAEGADAAASKIIATRPYPDTASYGDYINALWGDSTHIYAGGITTNTIRKYLKSDLSYIGETASYGGFINALWGDDTHVYAGGSTTNTVRKYLKSDLSYIGETASYGDTIRALWGDDTHIYAGGQTTNTVRKYLKSDLSYIGETASYGGILRALWGDSTHVYAGGSTTNTVRKYLKSDLSYIGATASYGGIIYALSGDDTHIYAGGATTNTVRKYLKSDLSYIGETASYGGTVYALWGDDTHVYAGGSTTNTVRKYLKSDLSYIGETASYGSEIYALWGDATHVYAGGAITNTVRKYSSLAYSLVADVTATNATHAVASIWSVRILETGTDFQIIVTNTATAKAVTVYKASGIATTTPFDKSATNTGTGTSATVGPTATLSQADELIICATAVEDEIDDAHGSWTTGATYCSGNEQFDATNGGGDSSNIQVHSVAEVVTATTAQNAADGVHDSSSWAAAIATYKMASGYDISNTPTSKAFSIVAASSTYYAFGSAPSNPLQDSEATFTVTNNGAVTIDLDMKLADCTGGVGWNIASGSPGANEIRVTAYWSGQNPASGLVLANTDAEFYDALAASGTKKWDFKLETGSSFTDGVAKSCILTLTATAED